MTSSLYLFTGFALFGIGLAATIMVGHWVRKILALNVMGSGVFLVMIALGYRGPGLAADPVLQALVLTGIVVSVCTTALGLWLVTRLRDSADEGSSA